jgi:myosin heavy subunit
MSQEEERLKGLFLSLRAYDADTYLDFVHYVLLQPRTDPQATTPKEKEALLVTIPDRNDKNHWLIKYVRSDPAGFRSNPKELRLQTDLEFAKLRTAAAQSALKSYLDKRDATANTSNQDALKEQIARQDKVIQELKSQLGKKTVEENSDLVRKANEWDRRLNTAIADAKSKAEQVERFGAENACLRAEVKKFQSPDMLADEIQEKNRIKMQEQKLKDDLKALQDENASLKKTIVKLEFTVRDVRGEGTVNLNNQQMEFDAKLAQAMQGMENLKLRATRAEEQARSLGDQLQQYKKQTLLDPLLAKAEERVAEAQRQRDELQQQLEAFTKSDVSKLPAIEEELRSTKAKLDILMQDTEAKKKQIADAEAKLSEASRERDALRNNLTEMEKKHLEQANNTVNTIVRIKWQSQLYACVWEKLVSLPNIPFTVETLVQLEAMAAKDRSDMSVEGFKTRSEYYTEEKKAAPPQPNS